MGWESDTYSSTQLNLGDWTTVTFDIAARIEAAGMFPTD